MVTFSPLHSILFSQELIIVLSWDLLLLTSHALITNSTETRPVNVFKTLKHTRHSSGFHLEEKLLPWQSLLIYYLITHGPIPGHRAPWVSLSISQGSPLCCSPQFMVNFLKKNKHVLTYLLCKSLKYILRECHWRSKGLWIPCGLEKASLGLVSMIYRTAGFDCGYSLILQVFIQQTLV